MRRDERKYLFLLGSMTALLLFTFLGYTYFNTKGEPREAIVAMSMLNSGNWVLPLNNGGEIAFKPPFFHWLIAVGSWLTGGVTEYTSRFPSALALATMIIACFFFFRKYATPKLAFVTGLLTLTNFEVERAGMNCRVDMLLAACMVLALYFLFAGVETRKKSYFVGAVLSMSGAMLTKGPVGVILPCFVLFVYELLQGHKWWRVVLRYALLAVASLLIPLLWYYAAYKQGGSQFLQLVYEENVLRFLGKMKYGSHENPPIYNVLTVVTGYLPYTLLVAFSLFALNYKKCSVLGQKTWWTSLFARLRAMDKVRLFSLLSFALIFIFYCIPKSKRSVYLLPIYPFIAYFLAEYIFYLWHNKRCVVSLFGKVMAVLSILASLALAYVRLFNLPATLFKGRHAVQNMEMVNALHSNPLGFWGVMSFLLPLGFGILYFVLSARRKKERGYPFYGIFVMPYVLFLCLAGFFQPTLLNAKSDKAIAARIQQVCPSKTIYSFIPYEDKELNNKMHFFTINFYMNDKLLTLDYTLPDSGYVVIGQRDLKGEFTKRFGRTHRFRLIYDTRHQCCDTGDDVCLYRFDRNK